MSPSPFYDRQRAEQAAALESVSQAARWAVPVGVAQTAAGRAGFPISGDHRPGRTTLEHVIPCLACGAEIRIAREAPHFEQRRAAAMHRHVERDPRHAG